MSTQPTQQQPTATYTPEQHHSLSSVGKAASYSQLVAAADFISQMFQANSIPFAFMGGFALKLRGSERDTEDIDVAVGCTMQRLIEVVSTQPRVCRPAGPTSGAMRVFVQVGEQSDPIVPELWIIVDLMLPGVLGAPEDPQQSSEVVTFNTSAGQLRLPIIDIFSAMASKLNSYFGRHVQKDYEDILFLITTYPQQIYEIRTRLDAPHRQEFVRNFAQVNTAQNAIRRVKYVLGVP